MLFFFFFLISLQRLKCRAQVCGITLLYPDVNSGHKRQIQKKAIGLKYFLKGNLELVNQDGTVETILNSFKNA